MSPIRRRRWFPAVVVPVLVIAAGLAVFLSRDAAPESTVAATGPTTGAGDGAAGAAGSGTATSPTTSTAPYTIKPEPTFVATDSPPAAGGPDVVLTYAGYEPSTGTVRANGFVAGVIRDGASCTLTLTSGNREISTSSEAVADATTTSCGLMETEAGVPSGTWEATLSYSGTRSASIEVQVP